MKKAAYIEALITLALVAALAATAASIGVKLAYGAPRCRAHGTTPHCH